MPQYRRRTYVRRRRPAKKNTAVRRVARAEAKKVLNKAVESKIFDGAVPTAGVDWLGTGNVWNVTSDPSSGTLMTQGTGLNQYVGTVMRPTYLMIRWQMAPADPTNMLRILVIQDLAGGIPTVPNVLQSTGNVRAPLSALDTRFDNTYRVIADRTFSLDTTTAVQRVGKIKIGMRQLRPVHFLDAIGTLEKAGIYILAVSDSGVAAHPTLQLYWRLHYKDA